MPQIDPKRLEELADIVYNRANAFNEYTLQTIGRRIKSIGSLSAYDQQTLKNMADISGDMESITKELARVTEMNIADIEEIYTQTVTEGVNSYKPLYDFRGMEFVPFAENEYAQFLVNHWAKETSEQMINLSRTKALSFTEYDAYRNVVGVTPLEGAFQKAIDDAVIAKTSGTVDFHTAMRETLKKLGGSGVRVNYGSGITRRLDTMVRQNLLYGAKQAAQAYDEYVGKELGCDGFEVDYHPHPRLSHEFMGGEMFSYKGKVTINGITYEDGTEALECLKHYGCLHFKFDVILGVSEPSYDPKWLEEQKAKDKELIEYNGIKKTGYQWKQSQRQIETMVRQESDIAKLADAAGNKTLARNAREKISAYRAKYDDLCDKVGLEKRYNRMATYKNKGFAHTQEKGVSKKRATETRENIVDVSYLKSKEYKQKFDSITDNESVNNSIYRYSKAMLTHRQGTYYEDIYIIDGATGNFVAKETNSVVENIVKYSQKTEQVVRSRPNELISIHNHGTNNPPTGSDLGSAGYHKYKMGVVACHNGDVYTYQVGKIPFSAKTFDKTVDKFKAQGYNEIEAFVEALDEFRENYGIRWRKL